ncbi:ubiquitin-like protein Pup [Micrococcoides hystricis]|uniref:Prokaryotic ubiquitin-like protein Pup n=1 Tax=Micrococcoides hystricis TaxID=1572761 RepID=A0ABV6P786_9MICC
MSQQPQVNPQRSTSAPTEQEQTQHSSAPVTDTAGVDDLLDEIDSVLETNAEEFVKGFVQKGGQ